MPAISFFSEDIDFSLPKPRKTTAWLKEVISIEGGSLENLNFIFCSDSYLHSLNEQYLNHTTLTDIITFDNAETEGEIEGDIFISIDRVRENAEKFGVSFENELHRVLVHGVLHLLGYSDKTKAEKSVMRQKEDIHLSLPTVPRETKG